MEFVQRKTYRFEPDYKDNLSLPKSQRISGMVTRPDLETRAELTEIEVARSFSKREVKEETESGGKKKLNFLRRQDTGRILRECLNDIKNVTVIEEDEEGKSAKKNITTGAELATSTAFGISELAQKFCAEILKDELGEEEEKNSESPSSST